MMVKSFRLLLLTSFFIGLTACATNQEMENNKIENSEKETLEEVNTESKNTKEQGGGVAAKEEEGTKKIYHDFLSSKDKITKKILYENLSLDDAKEINGKINVTLESVQYAEITPSETSKPLYENSAVVLTVKLKLENYSNQLLNGSVLGTMLRANDSQISYISQSSSDLNKQSEEVAVGASSQMLRVFLIEKNTFAKIHTLKLEFGPFRSMDGEELFSGQQVEFEIPVPS